MGFSLQCDTCKRQLGPYSDLRVLYRRARFLAWKTLAVESKTPPNPRVLHYCRKCSRALEMTT